LVSITSLRSTLTAQQSLQHILRHAGFPRFSADAITETLELGHVQVDQSLVFIHRNHHRHVPLLTLDNDSYRKLRYTPAMRVISNRALLRFSADHKDAQEPLQAWRKAVESGSFARFADLKACFSSVDRVGRYYVFDIGGNKYRVIAAIHFNRQMLFVRHVFTHRQYDRWKP
jgi:mRNA interferase HigB